MNSLMTSLWNLVVIFVANLPWAAIALLAVLAFMRRKTSKILLVQALGAAGMFIVALGQWLLVIVMNWAGVTYDMYHAETIIYQFMLFLCLVIFASGYCIERFSKRKDASGFPVQP